MVKFVQIFLPIRTLPYTRQLREPILILYSVLLIKELTSTSKMMMG